MIWTERKLGSREKINLDIFISTKLVVVVVYIFRHFNHYIFTKLKKNNEEERSSGTTRTGVSQKDPRISEKTKEEEKC